MVAGQARFIINLQVNAIFVQKKVIPKEEINKIVKSALKISIA
jgi:hypothetical protein